MRRRLAIATLVSTLLAAPLWGQRRGGVSMARPGLVSRPVMAHRGPIMANRGPFIGRRFGAGFGGNFRGRFFVRDRFLVRRRRLFFGFSPLFSFYPWSDVYPSYFDSSYSAAPSSYGAAYDSASAYAVSTELTNTIARLSDELEHLRTEREAREALPPKAEPEKNPDQPESAVLVFQDKHIQEIQNYALVGSTLWILNEQRATKVPLSSLDIATTNKINEERGKEFHLPE